MMLEEIFLFAVIGFAARLVDGALGVAYGLTAVLVSTGTHPAVASASVHAAEAFTPGASAMAHWRLQPINRPQQGDGRIPPARGHAHAAARCSSSPNSRAIRR